MYECPTTQPMSLAAQYGSRSEEHTSELQSPCNLVCRLLLEKKTQNTSSIVTTACFTPVYRPPHDDYHQLDYCTSPRRLTSACHRLIPPTRSSPHKSRLLHFH